MVVYEAGLTTLGGCYGLVAAIAAIIERFGHR